MDDINGLDERGLTPLMWASAYGQVPTAALLLKAGAMHSVKGPDGETAIHLAAAGGHTDIIRLLIAAGASVNEIDDVLEPISCSNVRLNLLVILLFGFVEFKYPNDVCSLW